MIYSDIFDTENYYFSYVTKSRQWEYEQEWRIEPSDKRRYVDINGCIKSIRLGVNFKSDFIIKIREMCNGLNIDFYKASLDKNEYKIKFRKLSKA